MRKWAAAYAAATLPLVIASFALPRYHLVLWGLLGWSAAAAVVVGVIRNRPARRLPWVLVTLALVTFVSGDIAYDVLTDVLRVSDPFPSLADAFYLATYPLFACGLLGLARSRSRNRNLGPVLDALIVAASCAIYLVEPYVRASDTTLFEKVVSISYPVGDIAILCVLARLVLTVDLRNWSVRLLTLGAVGLLAADISYGGLQLTGSWRAGGPTDAGWVLFYVCWGAAALHPSMRELTETHPRREKYLNVKAFVLLSGAALVAPVLLVWRVASDGLGGDIGVIGVSSGVVFLLVMARVTSLARGPAAQVDLERSLRAIGERLVAASGPEQVDSAALAAVRSLGGSRVVACAVAVPEGRFARVVAAEPEELVGVLLELAGAGRHGNSLGTRLAGGDQVPGTARGIQWSSFGFGGRNGPERRVVVAHRGSSSLGSTEVEDALAAQLTLAVDRVHLAEDLHQRQNEAKFRSLIRNVSDVILVVGANGDVRSETPSIEAVLGYSDETARALRLTDLLSPEEAPEAIASIRAMFAGTHSGSMQGEWRIRHADGHWLDMDVVGNDLSEDAEVAGVVLTMRDLSDRKVLERELRYQAAHDSLTKLPNRVRFDQHVTSALRRRSRLNTDVSVLLLDIDDFKVVNDTLGHPAGDELLVQFADRLVNCLRAEDLAARFGGDEFAVCIEVEANQLDNAATAQRIISAMAKPFRVADTAVDARVSIGISLAGHATEGPIDMLREADLALYAAKNEGKNSFRFFEDSLQHAVLARLEFHAALETAIDNDRLRLDYQPVLELEDGTVAGVEVLVSWEHPTLGLLPPAEFISRAEDAGLAVPLGHWVLDKACADLERWQRGWVAKGRRPLHLAVNLSSRQLQSPDFLRVVDDTIRGHHIDPSWLTFEISENLLAQEPADVLTRLHALHDRGIALAVDHFGTQYSPLSHLRRFPLQVIKIDSSLVTRLRGSDFSDSDPVIAIRAVVSTAKRLGLGLVALGVEDEAQRQKLASLGCTYGQGPHLGRPLPAEWMDELIGSAEHTRGPGARTALANAVTTEWESRAAIPSASPTQHRPRRRHDHSDARSALRRSVSARTNSTESDFLGEQVRGDPRWADLERLRSSNPMMDAVIEEVRGRQIRIGDHWLSDFASCNYLGFDLDEEIIDAVDGAVRRWGTHPGWSRLLGNPRLYCDIEEQLTELLGAPDTLVLPTITHIHTSVIPLLAGQGWVFVDSRAHKTIFDGAAVAAGQGAVLRRFRSNDGRSADDLSRQLDEVPAGVSRLVCMDGVNSMTGNLPDLAEFAQVTRAHEALLYVDDAHGFGIIGERDPLGTAPYGLRGNSIVRHADETYENLVLVGGFSKSYSSMLAFLALPTWLKNHLKVAAPPYLYSGPSPTASLATVLAGMQVNAARGEPIRADLCRKTARVLDTVRALELSTPNRSGLPIIEVPLRRAEDIDAAGQFLFDRGIYVTLAAYPLVPRRDVGFRIQVTAANSDDEIEQLCGVLGSLSERFELAGARRSTVE